MKNIEYFFNMWLSYFKEHNYLIITEYSTEYWENGKRGNYSIRFSFDEILTRVNKLNIDRYFNDFNLATFIIMDKEILLTTTDYRMKGLMRKYKIMDIKNNYDKKKE